MNHNQIKEKLSAFFDRELPEEERSEIALHSRSCSECRKVLEDWARLRTAFSEIEKPEPSENFVESVMDRLEVEELTALSVPRERSSILRWLVPAFGYAFALFLVFAAVTPQEPSVDTGTVLLSEVSEGAQWAFGNEPLDLGKLLNGEEDLQK